MPVAACSSRRRGSDHPPLPCRTDPDEILEAAPRFLPRSDRGASQEEGSEDLVVAFGAVKRTPVAFV